MKSTQKRKPTKLPSLFLALLCLALLTHAALSCKAHAQESTSGTSRTVRVGYYENEVFQEGAQEGAVRTGYAYEYYCKLAEYTGWKYEYVFGSYSELYQKLLNGEIDLLAGLAYTEEREGLIGYPHSPMGNETYNLVKHSADTSISSDPSSFAHKKIGVLDSAMAKVLRQYLDDLQISATVVTFPEYTSLFDAFYANKVDILAAEGNGTYGNNKVDVLCSYGTSDYYLCVSIKRPDLLIQLDNAQMMLAVDEPNYLNSLNLKYYPISLTSRVFSSMERSWLKSHSSMRVGYLKHYLPYSDTDEKGVVTGIITDILPAFLEIFEKPNLAIQYQGFDNYEDMIAALSAEEVDLVFPVGGGLYYSEENGMYQSNPVVTASTELIYTGEYSDAKLTHIAVNSSNSIQYYYVHTHFPDAQITYYSSTEECLDSVLAGITQSTTLNGLRASDILKNSKYRELSLRQLTQSDARCFGVKIGNEGLLKLLNRGLNVLGNDFAQNQVYRYSDKLYTYTFGDLVRDHMGVFGSLLLALALSIILFLVRDIVRTRKQMREKEDARRVLEEKNNELERSQTALAESNEIFADAGFGIWHIVVQEGQPSRMRGNTKMKELLGISGREVSEEEMYDSWYSHIVEEDIPSVQRSIAEMLDGKLSENTYRWMHPLHGMIYVRCGGTAKALENGLKVLRGYHSDVTVLVKEEQEQKEALSNALMAAEHANHAKTTFLNNMSHDIRTPMNAIVGFTGLAASRIDNKEQVKEYLQKIAVSSQHLLSLINDVLDMSRIESGKMIIEESMVHLPDVIHDLRTIIQANVSAKQQDLFIDTQDIVNENIITDKLRLNQILLNILSNAIKFTPAHGTISLRVIEKSSPQEGCTCFEFRVKDNGIGMSENFQKTIFEAFTREKSSTVSGIQGTGLGMAITKNIVDMMNGSISLHSKEGEGTEFIVNIPCKISGEPAKNKDIPELAGLRALVADDDTDSCLSICSMLREIGMRPDWTNYGKEAVIRAKEAFDQADEFKVYIIDWMMPDQNGIETVRKIRRIIGESTPIIILTAYDWSDIEEEALEAGVTAFCAKPLFMSELREALAEPFRLTSGSEPSRFSKPDFTGRRILLAEDNEMNQMIAVAILEEAGFVIDIAADGIEAVHKMRDNPAGTYDVILMDIQMPRMDGYEAAKQIRALDDPAKAGIPILAVTANAFEEDRKTSIAVGMNGHLAKPYDIPAMMDTLAEILQAKPC